MADRKSFLLRVDSELLEAFQKWADDELRSLNGQIEYELRKALANNGRGLKPKNKGANSDKTSKI